MPFFSATAPAVGRFYTTDKQEPISTPGSSSSVDPKIVGIAEQIENLTLKQASELVSQLKVCVYHCYLVSSSYFIMIGSSQD